MPALNEERHIADAIRSIYPSGNEMDFEILVVDGGSSDATTQVVTGLAQTDPHIKLVHNPARIQAAAVNLAARVADARATVLLRADCHAEYPPGFAAMCLKA
ncbi:MAG: glycosyl transferase family 2, partial [Hyphomicrobiales bacterium]|nr:glycosyl transferase family 2 [Hyphomicrobiales bacterium]